MRSTDVGISVFGQHARRMRLVDSRVFDQYRFLPDKLRGSISFAKREIEKKICGDFPILDTSKSPSTMMMQPREIQVSEQESRQLNDLISPKIATEPKKQISREWQIEATGILALGLMTVYFLAISWRKWPDPLIDGYQWYTAWQISEGAVLYRDLSLAYGPLSSYFNAFLFKCFGPGMMIMVTANLIIYSLILGLIYVAFRMAWGRLGAFVASSVFISVFSFSQLQNCGNFNFAAPYSHEILHGTLVILVAIFIASEWCRSPSKTLAFLLGFCGGLTAVLKPEFMLAGGILGIAAISIRLFHRQRVQMQELTLAILGVMLPTLAFTIWFAQAEPWRTAFLHASHGWWIVVGENVHRADFQQSAMGMNEPWRNMLFELSASASVIVTVGAISVIGWAFSQRLTATRRAVAVSLACMLIYLARPKEELIEIGLCFPGLIAFLFIVFLRRLTVERRSLTEPNPKTAIAFMLLLAGGAMLARMALNARVYDFGFYQAAFAGMVIAAVMVKEVPQWIRFNKCGRGIVLVSCMALIAFVCSSIARTSYGFWSTKTQPVGTGLDRFYAFDEDVDETGALANWVLEQLEPIPLDATLLVVPEGPLMNYISRHKYPLNSWISIVGGANFEEANSITNRLQESSPDYVVLISRPMPEHGIRRFGAEGTPGHLLLKWIKENYQIIASRGGDPFAFNAFSIKGAVILRKI